MERLLIAGRAVWFHLWKLFWPTHLTFIYPRWQIDAGVWWQYLFPLGVAAAVGRVLGDPAAVARCRWPPCSFFGGTLFPVLGFFNLYTFRYSLVANHYQYLASLGIITLAAAGGGFVAGALGALAPAGRIRVCLALLATLAGLTWRQSRMYADVETLYRTTIDGESRLLDGAQQPRPGAGRRGQIDDAIAHYQKAREINPNVANVYCALGWILERKGKPDDAMVLFQRALAVEPNTALVYFNIGKVLAGRGRLDEAIARLRQALQPRAVLRGRSAGIRHPIGRAREESWRLWPNGGNRCDRGQTTWLCSATLPGRWRPILTRPSATAPRRSNWPSERSGSPARTNRSSLTSWLPPTPKQAGFPRPWPPPGKPWTWPRNRTSGGWPKPYRPGSRCTKRGSRIVRRCLRRQPRQHHNLRHRRSQCRDFPLVPSCRSQPARDEG